VDMRMRDEVERQPATARTAHGEPDRPVRRREQRKGGREHGTRLLLRVAEEAPRPLAPLDVYGCELAQLGAHWVDPRGHEVEELARLEPERRPVELLVRHEAVVLAPTAAAEPDPEEGRMRGAGEFLDAHEGRKGHLRLTSDGTGKR